MLEPEDLVELMRSAAARGASTAASSHITGSSGADSGSSSAASAGAGYGPGEYCIVDVRDDDFAGGNISGALHCSSESFSRSGVYRLAGMLCADSSNMNIGSVDSANASAVVPVPVKCKLFVFHCMMSQQRGPACAEEFARHCDASPDVHTHDLQVVVLRGGFRKWKHRYQGRSDLCENEQ